eukprot:CAMPEP_0114252472 /NCGR_PEP_ID=MMETSP0058-20121206/15856_1 /TAXON_ID=36894 /ORGANISM="Pyramimonas parkeae, CCMP726" /LENGTH=153 /DNA_ID=CAMNT_0001366411 /DNA_START=98 /DNA_END=559 /DNA_ORIENTATION=-
MPKEMKHQVRRSTSGVARCQGRLTVKAVIDPSAALAISQQEVGFALVFSGENVYSYINSKAGTKGRPNLVTALPVAAGTLVAAALLSSGSESGLLLALALTTAAQVQSVRRFQETEMNMEDWPGDKAWPALSTLVAFFAFISAAEGLGRVSQF